MDVYNAFLQGDLDEEVYMEMPEGLKRPGENKVCRVYKESMYRQFKLKDLGELKFFLGTEVLRTSEGVILNQRKYILELIVDAGLTGAKPVSTPLESNLRLTSVEHDLVTGYTGDVVLNDITFIPKVGWLLFRTQEGPSLGMSSSLEILWYPENPRNNRLFQEAQLKLSTEAWLQQSQKSPGS
ncbi:uncharacterized protein LOC125847054 [Solanum stenotomum]|uniref:uncharacterized protein LOC125847054 n=1 Tax=Solanum stenotomum TaxID=172797 RepID=UPI0020D17429|nr:uncharacterized protein LOC125847054 [Solanum stenotomum]